MEVKKYIEFLLKLLNKDNEIDVKSYQEELNVNIYLTLLSLSNIKYSDDIDKFEYEEITDFLRKLNNLKVKIQLKRKPAETNKLANDLIMQYYENINILSLYIKDGIELENIINTMDAKSLTNLIDSVTKYKMNKEDMKDDTNKKREELSLILPSHSYYIENGVIYIKNKDNEEDISLGVSEFLTIYGYLLNPDNYSKIYKNKGNQKNNEIIKNNLIKLLLVKDYKIEELDKVLIPLVLTYISAFDIKKYVDVDTSKFNVENIKITELYELADKGQGTVLNGTPKCNNIAIPNEYLLDKLEKMIIKGNYYAKEDSFVFENVEDKVSDFRMSIKIDELKEPLKIIMEKLLLQEEY